MNLIITAPAPHDNACPLRDCAQLFPASTCSYGDRVVLSLAAADISRDLHLDPLPLGYLFSSFARAYAAAQLPPGGLLDRFGSKRAYGLSILS